MADGAIAGGNDIVESAFVHRGDMGCHMTGFAGAAVLGGDCLHHLRPGTAMTADAVLLMDINDDVGAGMTGDTVVKGQDFRVCCAGVAVTYSVADFAIDWGAACALAGVDGS